MRTLGPFLVLGAGRLERAKCQAPGTKHQAPPAPRDPSLVLAALLALISMGAALPVEVQPSALLEHIRFLASDEMKGRGNGTAELNRAADYIAQQYKATGLRPGGDEESWFQSFELVAGLNVGSSNSLSIDSRRHRIRLVLGTSYYPLAAPANDSSSVASAALDDVPVVFGGYGLSAPAVGYDDYERVDVAGKAVLIFSHEPQEQDANSKLNGTRPMPQTTLHAKAAAARAKGAKLLLVVSDPSHRADQADYALFSKDPDAEDHGIPVLRVRRSEMQTFLDAWQLDAAARSIDRDLAPRSQPLPGVTVDYTEHLVKNRRIVRNVVGVLPGSDPEKAREAIVIGAHYDHVGLGGRLSV
ncbi:MAG: PA domain-containing protein, partial [Vicinamibacterales bacterium]